LTAENFGFMWCEKSQRREPKDLIPLMYDLRKHVGYWRL